ncbi:uncharacterized protein C6orf118 [Labrus bergylta]|uniref:uncharacterized protein C6orf118 n=1 Tax=Labrus bergylta TaxID=56723 RepID=UPI003314135F
MGPTCFNQVIAMSGGSKAKKGDFGGDIHRLLLAAEAGQKADILTYSSGHLGPRSLNQSLPQREVKKSFWRASQGQDDPLGPLTHRQKQIYPLADIKKKEVKEDPPSKFSTCRALVQCEGSRSREDQMTDCSSHADRREDDISLLEIVCMSSNILPVQVRAHPEKRSDSPSDPAGKLQLSASLSDREGLKNVGQVGPKQLLGRQVITKQQELWAGTNVAETHERKLKRELKKLSVHSRPSRDRLVVFSDVFDDVCDGSPVFGCILREIKTEYDLYVNHLMASQTPDMSFNTSLKDFSGDRVRGMELEDAEEEICRLEQEVGRALEDNQRVQNELEIVQAKKGPEDSDMTDLASSKLGERGTAINSVQSKRLQVLNVWREIQQLEEEMKEKLVPAATTTSTERCIKDKKTEIMRLIASNHRLKAANKDLENDINMLLGREKASKATRRMLWQDIHCDLQTD